MFSTLRGSRLLKEMRGIEEKLDVVNQNAAKQDKCFNFKFEKASKRARSDYQSKHWVVIKYAKIMTEGKLMPRFAKWAANRLTMRGEEGEDFALIVHTCEGNAAVVNPAMSTPSCTLQWTYIKNDCATKRTNKMFHICTQQEFSQPSCQHVGWARGGAWARPKWNFHVMASTFIWCVCVFFIWLWDFDCECSCRIQNASTSKTCISICLSSSTRQHVPKHPFTNVFICLEHALSSCISRG